MTTEVNNEAYLAGALLIDGGQVVQAIRGIVSRNDFHMEVYGAIFSAALSLAADNEVIDGGRCPRYGIESDLIQWQRAKI